MDCDQIAPCLLERYDEITYRSGMLKAQGYSDRSIKLHTATSYERRGSCWGSEEVTSQGRPKPTHTSASIRQDPLCETITPNIIRMMNQQSMTHEKSYRNCPIPAPPGLPLQAPTPHHDIAHQVKPKSQPLMIESERPMSLAKLRSLGNDVLVTVKKTESIGKQPTIQNNQIAMNRESIRARGLDVLADMTQNINTGQRRKKKNFASAGKRRHGISEDGIATENAVSNANAISEGKPEWLTQFMHDLIKTPRPDIADDVAQSEQFIDDHYQVDKNFKRVPQDEPMNIPVVL